MAVLKPFKAIRPKPEFVEDVAAPPYDVIGFKDAAAAAKNKPYSFLHVEKSEIDFSAGTDAGTEEIYSRAKENLDGLIKNGVYGQDPENCFYIYRQTAAGRTQTGLVGCVSIYDYINNVVRKHEKTKIAKEKDRVKHVDHCDANTSPVFLTYRPKAEITETTRSWIKAREPVYDFVSYGAVRNSVWVVDDPGVVEKISALFAGVENLYIADGHHRAAAAVEVGLKRGKSLPEFDGGREFNYFLAALFPGDELKISSYNRAVGDLNGLTDDEFLAEVEKSFFVEPIEESVYSPDSAGTFVMFLGKKRYRLTARSVPFDPRNPLASLDVSILHNRLISPVLGVSNPRTDRRIAFIGGGDKGPEELERRIGSDMRVAFSLFPLTIEKLMQTADAGEIMPPKSTWFEPKPLSGLFVHSLK